MIFHIDFTITIWLYIISYCPNHSYIKLSFLLGFRKEVLEYIKSCEVLTKKLLKILLKRLNVKKIEETKHSMLMGTKRVNLNYYPKCPQPELAIGIGRHSDSSTITILPQGVIGGLWVRKSESDPWIHVAPINGAL